MKAKKVFENIENILKPKSKDEFKHLIKDFEFLVSKPLGLDEKNFKKYKLIAGILGKKLYSVLNNWNGTDLQIIELPSYKFCAYGFIGDNEKSDPQPIKMPLIKNNNLNVIMNSKPSEYGFSGTFLIGNYNNDSIIVRYTGGGGPHNKNYYIYVADEDNQFMLNVDNFKLAIYGITQPSYYSVLNIINF